MLPAPGKIHLADEERAGRRDSAVTAPSSGGARRYGHAAHGGFMWSGTFKHLPLSASVWLRWLIPTGHNLSRMCKHTTITHGGG